MKNAANESPNLAFIAAFIRNEIPVYFFFRVLALNLICSYTTMTAPK
jgi:hypothetical protein